MRACTRSNRHPGLIERLHHQDEVPIGEARRYGMSYLIRPHFELNLKTLVTRSEQDVELQAAFEHFRLAADKEPVVGQGPWIARDSPTAGSDIVERSGRRHVASLALFPFLPRRAYQPFRIGTIDRDAKDSTFMARCTVAAVAVNRREGIFAAIHVIERAEE